MNGDGGIVRVINMTTPAMTMTRSISGREGPRLSLARLARAATGGLVDTRRAAEAWSVSPAVASARLHRMVRAGWVLSVRKGLFFVVPLEAGARTTIDDPWVLASRAFSPCYIGGWSAAEHWGLTEQIFRSTFVVTAGSARTTSVTLLGSEFRTVRVSTTRVGSVAPIWRGTVRLAVSDRERTLADGLANPAWVGGVRHLAEMFATYRRSDHWSVARLLAALAAHPKGVAYKRLGYLIESSPHADGDVVAACLENKSSGVVRLDPAVSGTGKILKRWGLRMNVTLLAEDAS
jgi:predicted transcriptional regulator of viral defense system